VILELEIRLADPDQDAPAVAAIYRPAVGSSVALAGRRCR
jgi:hypothetical protein